MKWPSNPKGEKRSHGCKPDRKVKAQGGGLFHSNHCALRIALHEEYAVEFVGVSSALRPPRRTQSVSSRPWRYAELGAATHVLHQKMETAMPEAAPAHSAPTLATQLLAPVVSSCCRMLVRLGPELRHLPAPTLGRLSNAET